MAPPDMADANESPSPWATKRRDDGSGNLTSAQVQTRRLIGGAWAAASVVGLALAAIVAHSAWVDYQRSMEVAARDTGYVASMLADHASRGLGEAIHALETVERDFQVRSAVPLPLVRQRLQTTVASKTATLDQLAAMTVFGRDGRPLVHSGRGTAPLGSLDISRLFRAMAYGSTRVAYLPPIDIPSTGERWVPIALRVTDHDGSFGGAIVAFVDPGHFSAYQAAISDRFPGTRTTVLVGTEALAAGPGPSLPSTALDAPTSGTSGAGSQSDGEDGGPVRDEDGRHWIVAQEHLPAGGIKVAAARPRSTVVDEWLDRRTSDLIVAGLSLVVLLTFTVLATRQIAQRGRAEAARDVARSQMLEAIGSMSEGFALYDGRERLILSNERYRSMFGAHADDVRSGADVQSLRETAARAGLTPAAAAGANALIRPGAEAGTHVSNMVHQLANEQWLRVTERPTADGGTVALYTDISELKERECDLRRAKEQAETANRAKTEFLAIVSHELRTPLNAIIGFSDLICGQTFGAIGNPKYEEYAEAINSSGTHLLKLINDILDISKIESGKFELYEEDLDVARVAAGVSELMQPHAHERGITLTCDVDGGLPYLYGDERSVKQMLLNLASNAVKFTPQQGRVRISAWQDDEGRITLSVRDTGIGIAADDIARVLEPFGQVEGAMSREYEGTGLGLPLTARLARLHGGELHIDSEPGEGTTVTVTFPSERVRQPARRRAAAT